jgi:short-subunit dehydrogenase
MKTKDCTTLITGGLGGIGFALAKEAARDNNQIILVQRSQSDKATDELLDLGAKSVLQIQKDFTKDDAIPSLMKEIGDKGFEVDILINNAGMLTGGLIEDQKDEDIVRMLDVNLKSLILLSKAFIPQMLKRKKGKIVNNSSVSGVMCIPCASTYAASKSGVVSFTKCNRQELDKTGVTTLLMLTPGIKTDMYDEIKTLYDGHLDLDFLTAMPPEEWAEKVWKAIKNDDEEVLPSGSNRIGLWLAKHIPKVFEGQMSKYFSR